MTWGYRDPKEKVVVLEFSTSRSAQILPDFFPKDWAGVVQTDGAAMYPSAFKHRPNIVHVECHIHLRRYVLDAIKSDEHQAVPLARVFAWRGRPLPALPINRRKMIRGMVLPCSLL